MTASEQSHPTRVLIVDPQGEEYAERIAEHSLEVTVDVAHSFAEALPLTRRMDVLVGLAVHLYEELVRDAPQLKWIHALTSGTDTIDRFASLRAGIIVTSGRGIHGPQVAEMTFLHMLYLARNVAQMAANHAQGRWERWPQPLLWQKSMTVIGLGVVGREIAARARGFGMSVTGVSRNAEPAEPFDRIYPREQLQEAVAHADFVVVIVPYDAGTHHLVDASVLAAMKKSAYLINVARGGVVDEAALVQALKNGALAGAGLDVFATEPLPPDSPLWTAPNVFLTPHVAGFSDVYAQQAAPILLENLALFLKGETGRLVNRVR